MCQSPEARNVCVQVTERSVLLKCREYREVRREGAERAIGAGPPRDWGPVRIWDFRKM